MDNKTIQKIQELNSNYEYLMYFTGLADSKDENDLPVTTIDQLQAIEDILFSTLSKDYFKEVSVHLEALKEAIDTAQNIIVNEVKYLTK